MKEAGMIIALTLCVFIGIIKSVKLKKRVTELEDLIKAVSFLRSEIVFSAKSLPSVLSELSQKADIPLLQKLKVGQADTVQTMYVRVKKETECSMSLKESDWSIVDGFFSSIGKGVGETQRLLCDAVAQRLCDAVREAEGAYLKYSKLYVQSGFLGGLFIILMLV